MDPARGRGLNVTKPKTPDETELIKRRAASVTDDQDSDGFEFEEVVIEDLSIDGMCGVY